jgi:hypothetical protein
MMNMANHSENRKKSEGIAGLAQRSSRGNMDEYEALRTIVAENPGLLMRILEKIRTARLNSNDKFSFGNDKKDDKNQK